MSAVENPPPAKRSSRRLVPIWVAVVSGVFGVVASVSAALISTAAGGPITVNVGYPPQQVQQVAVVQTTPPTTPTTPATSSAPETPPETTTPTTAPATLGEQLTYVHGLDFTTGGVGNGGPFSISGQRYEESFKKYCGESPGTQSPSGWNVAGYKRFTAVVGIADDEKSALGAIARISIKNQDGTNLIPPFDVALAKPRTIDIALNGAVQIQVVCAGRTSSGEPRGLFYATFGDAAIRR
jgi:hypothetical protein